MIKQVNLHYRTNDGRLRYEPGLIEFADGRIFFLKSPFKCKDDIKSMKGSKWHGFEETNPRKIWSVSDCTRNRINLAYMMNLDPLGPWFFDREVEKHEYTRPLMPHQCDLTDAALTYHYQIFAAEMGCVDGEAIVHVNRAGRGFQITLADLYHKFHGGATCGGNGPRTWDLSIPTHIRSLCGDTLRLNRVVDVLDKGIRPVVKVTLKSGKCLRLTADHEVCTGYAQFRPADHLTPGDTVLSNGVRVDKDGYVRVHGVRHHRESTHGVYEHILVAEKMLGRLIGRDEVVHHKNGIKHDNRPENLEVLARGHSEHARLHGSVRNYRNLNGGRGGRVRFVPVFDQVVSVIPDGEAHVYDVVCADPHRNFVANGVVVHNCGKTLSAQEVIERSNASDWYWIGPKTSIPNIKREFRKWNFPFDKFNVEFMTYEGLVRRMDEWKPGDFVPRGVIFDESSRLKTPTAQRTKAAQMLADLIREQYDKAGYVILMSGTPSPKTPLDWWSQVEIAYPGYLKEGSTKALEQRLAFMVRQEFDSGVSFNKRTGWKDNEQKCAVCGGWPDDDCHTEMAEEYHRYKPSENEVAYMYERLQGLVIIKHKKDCLTLPEKRYRRIYCKPAASILRVAQAIVQSAPNTVTGLTLLRELSDGFQYREVQDGVTRCTHCTEGKVAEWVDPERPDQTYEAVDMLDPEVVGRLVKRETDCPLCGGSCEVPKYVRETRQVPCPKDAALKLLLEENEEVGRIVIFAGFTGSVDRVQKLCQSQGWDVVRCDGRGFLTFTHDGAQVTQEEPLDYWGNLEAHPRVAFIAHPESGGMSLTLTEARMAVYWSNSWKPEYRIQSEDRIHRKGMDENLGCTIVDLIHLPSDERVLEVIRENRRLELMSMGTVMDGVNWDEPRGADDGVEIVEL